MSARKQEEKKSLIKYAPLMVIKRRKYNTIDAIERKKEREKKLLGDRRNARSHFLVSFRIFNAFICEQSVLKHNTQSPRVARERKKLKTVEKKNATFFLSYVFF